MGDRMAEIEQLIGVIEAKTRILATYPLDRKGGVLVDLWRLIDDEVPWLLSRVRALDALIAEAAPYIKTVSRSGNTAYDERSPDLYERMRGGGGEVE